MQYQMLLNIISVQRKENDGNVYSSIYKYISESERYT